jgi:hypothetical protein
VAPASTRQHSENFDDGTDIGSFSPDERLWVETVLTPMSADDGHRVPDTAQQLKLELPGWVVAVLYHAGTNGPLAAELPAAIDLPVRYDPSTREIIGVDVAATCAELEPCRSSAVRYFERTDSWLAPLRNIAATPRDARRAGASIFKDWKSALGDMAAERGAPSGAAMKCSWTDAEIEAMRRNAAILAIRWQNKPKEREKARAHALQTLALNAEHVRTGSLSLADFEVMIMREEVATAITTEEAASFRGSFGEHAI